MPFRLVHRSARWLTASLAIAALVAVLAVPAQAAPGSNDTERPAATTLVERVEAWLGSWLAKIPALDRPDGGDAPEAVSATSGSCVDPIGNPISCPDND